MGRRASLSISKLLLLHAENPCDVQSVAVLDMTPCILIRIKTVFPYSGLPLVLNTDILVYTASFLRTV